MNACANTAASNAAIDTFTAPNGMTLQRSKLYRNPKGNFIAKLDASGAQLDADATDHAMSYYIDHNLISAENVPGADARFTHDEATAFAAALIHGGYRDWKLPDVVQSVVMCDYTRVNPAVDLSVHPGATSVGYWTDEQTQWSLNETGDSRSFWYVYLLSGYVHLSYALYRFRARPVRVASPAGQ